MTEMRCSFSPEQKAFIKGIVFEAMPTILETHIASCPWGKKVARFIWVGIGIGITLSVLGITTLSELGKWIRP